MSELLQLGLRPPEVRSNPAPVTPQPSFNLSWFYDHLDTSDIVVNSSTVKQIASVASAIRLISQSVRSLPFHVQDAATSRKVTAHPAYRLISRAPSDESTIDHLMALVTESMLLHGCSYLQVTRNPSTKQVDGIWYLNPITVTPKRTGNDNRLVYSVTEGGKQQTLKPWVDIIPIIGAASLHDGVTPVSVLVQSREVFAKALAMQRFQTKFFSNFATPQMVLKTVQKVKPEQKNQMRADWESLHGKGGSGIAVLDQDLDVKVLSSGLKDNDVTALSAYAEQCAAAVFGVDIAMLGSATTSATNASLVETNLQFTRYTLGPILAAIENALTRGLCDDLHVITADTHKLLRMDPKSQAEVAKNSNCLTVAEARRIGYGLEPLGTDDDSTVLVQVNQTNLPNLKKTIPSQMLGQAEQQQQGDTTDE